MWIFLASDAMGFGGLLLAYAMLRVRATAWPDPALRFDRPSAAVFTFVLLFSGATMTAAVAVARAGKWPAARGLLCVTAAAGAAFVAGQAVEFRTLAAARHLGLTADHAAALFYVITGYHGLHVLVGVGMLAVLATRTSAAANPARAAAGVSTLEVASLYWQFVDLVWIVIFTVLYLFPPGTAHVDV
jgi:heme/copper-type cytochrome/quinol oxidase subunit 3